MSAAAAAADPAPGGVFKRYFLPAFALKGVIIGGGYATGRELAEFFLSQGAGGGLLALAVATVMWSLIAALTFAVAQHTRAFEYRAFFVHLLGRGAILFEVCFIAFTILLLAVFGAAAGEVGASLLGVPTIAGTIALAASIALIAALGQTWVEEMFKYVSIFLYAVYGVFLVLALSRFGPQIDAGLRAATIAPGWPLSGLAYGTYNIVGVVAVLPLLRHIRTRRNAVVAGAIAGPLAMAPALAFLVAMIAFNPEILAAKLPSDYLLQRLGSPLFRIAFQVMVFCALLESAVGIVHSINERAAAAAAAHRPALAASRLFRPVLTVLLLAGCMFVANAIGLVELIATGYRAMAVVFFFIFVLPLLVKGVPMLLRGRRAPGASAPAGAFGTEG